MIDSLIHPQAPILIHCLLCESSTLEESLLEHIQYNHMVYRKTLRQVLHSLHFPPVDRQLLDRLATECHNEAASATRNHNNLTPFARRKRSVSKVTWKALCLLHMCSGKWKEAEREPISAVKTAENRTGLTTIVDQEANIVEEVDSCTKKATVQPRSDDERRSR